MEWAAGGVHHQRVGFATASWTICSSGEAVSCSCVRVLGSRLHPPSPWRWWGCRLPSAGGVLLCRQLMALRGISHACPEELLQQNSWLKSKRMPGSYAHGIAAAVAPGRPDGQLGFKGHLCVLVAWAFPCRYPLNPTSSLRKLVHYQPAAVFG